jgi:hypothetical protein
MVIPPAAEKTCPSPKDKAMPSKRNDPRLVTSERRKIALRKKRALILFDISVIGTSISK